MGAALSQPEDNAMPDLEIDRSTISNMLQSILLCASPPSVAQLACSLWGLGSLTLVLSLTTALHQPAAGPVFGRYREAYYTILAAVLFVVVPVELGTAFFLPRCNNRGRLLSFATGLLPCAFVLLLIVISVGGFAVPFKL
ncbi:Monothiol glutaredoxin-S7, chloroplastic [Hordeum vulgare]|nr:Monothiol glutaredoxin-S7, chloroplastic [Hordeum vulgare]